MAAAIYLHGGPAGIEPGAMLLPPAITGAPCFSDVGYESVHRRDRVYLTTSANLATYFATARYGRQGAVYIVEPIGEIEPDPDWHGEPGTTVCTSSARVIEAHKPAEAIADAVKQRLWPKKRGAALLHKMIDRIAP